MSIPLATHASGNRTQGESKMTLTSEPTCIRRGECYSLEQFQKLARLGRHGMRAARHAGLRVRRAHGNAYVVGDDWLDYLEAADRSGDDNA